MDDRKIQKSLNIKKVEAILEERLSERELNIAKYRYGLFDEDMLDAKAIGKIFNIRGKKLVEAIQKIDEKAYNLLKENGLDLVVKEDNNLDMESNYDNID